MENVFDSRFGKHLETAQRPWLPESEFATIAHDLDAWSRTLPPVLHFNPSQTYIRKAKSQLSAFIFLHTAYHLCYLDLFRISLPKIPIPGATALWEGEDDHHNYRAVCQRTLFDHSNIISSILEEALKHGSDGLLDSMIGLTAHEAARYQILYSSLDTNSDTMDLIYHNVQINARTLTRLSSLNFKVDGMVPPHPTPPLSTPSSV